MARRDKFNEATEGRTTCKTTQDSHNTLMDKRRLKWSEVKQFYEFRGSYWAKTDHDDDPDALRNVMNPGQPLWFNRAQARKQERAYQALFDLLPPPMSGARALDIGCGSGRWCRFLSNRGYHTVGIDLQPELIQANRRRYPHLAFFDTSVQDYSAEEPFDLVSSVLVIQHNPYEEQRHVIRKIRELLRSGGYVIVLEGIREDRRPQFFPRVIDDWIELFENFGFRSIATQRYEYILLMGMYILSKEMRYWRASGREPHGSSRKEISLAELAAIPEPKKGYLLNSAKRLVVGLDTIGERVLARRDIAVPSFNCGFLFQAI